MSPPACKLGKDVGKPGAGNLDSKNRPGRLPDCVACARANEETSSSGGQTEGIVQAFFVWDGISFKPAQHELFVIEPIKEVCEEKGEEGDNFCGRGNDKHAAEKQKNLQSMSHCALGYFLIGGKQGSFENLDWRNEKVSERSSSPVCHLCLDVP